jgi:RNA polymerase sigma-70 factor (ECF subfamily)
VDAAHRDALEARIRMHFDAGDEKQAATTLLEGYGREVLGFLITRLRDRDAASEIFSQFTEDLWRGLDGFRWQSTARVWAYTLARHAASRYLRAAHKRPRNVPLSRAGPMSAIAQKIRTSTMTAFQTESRSRLAQLRENLPAEDQTVLVLRINRKLDWKEIAQVMSSEGNVVDDEELAKEAVRLRKRYQLAKDRLRRMAVEQGIVSPDRER